MLIVMIMLMKMMPHEDTVYTSEHCVAAVVMPETVVVLLTL